MKVGDYVRTKDGYIGKIIEFSYSYDFEICDGRIRKPIEIETIMTDSNYMFYDESDRFDKKDIIKSSPNIIDLIEEGDYVNGYIVNKITDIDTGLPVLCNFDLNTMRWTPLEEIDIWYSIVTKEQFESMEYKVGD